MCCGSEIRWSYIVDLYEKCCGASSTPGLSLVKISSEHIYLTSFSGMMSCVSCDIQPCHIDVTIF